MFITISPGYLCINIYVSYRLKVTISISIIIYAELYKGDVILGKNRSFTGYYKAKNKSKYAGDSRSIYYRSSWERLFCKWCDTNKNVAKWAIEPFKIPYFDDATGKMRMYNPDFYVEMVDGVKYLIEVKPKYETEPPKLRKGTEKFVIAESTYKTNTSKWRAAEKLCEKKKWSFKIVTEDTLKSMGIKIISSIPSIPQIRRKRPSKKSINNVNNTPKKKVRKNTGKNTGKKMNKGKISCQ